MECETIADIVVHHVGPKCGATVGGVLIDRYGGRFGSSRHTCFSSKLFATCIMPCLMGAA